MKVHRIISLLSNHMAKLLLVLAFAVISIQSSRATEYGIGPLHESDTVSFRSTAKLEFIEGMTQHIDGRFSFDAENPQAGVEGAIRVDLRTLKTGIETRDEHMRDNHLHTSEYPYAYFEILSVDPIPDLANYDSVYTLKIKGKFYIHGNFRKIDANLELQRKKLPSGGETIEVRAKFSINLDDCKIARPKALFLKLAETLEIEAVFTGSSLTDSKPFKLPDWPELD